MKKNLTFKAAWEIAARDGWAITRPKLEGTWLAWDRWPNESGEFEDFEFFRRDIGLWLRSAPQSTPPASSEMKWGMVWIMMGDDLEATDWSACPLPNVEP